MAVELISETNEEGAEPGSAGRTCIVCRSRLPASQLLMLSLHSGGLLAGLSHSGRGAHVCVKRECLLGLSSKLLSRAFKMATFPYDADCWLTETHSLAEHRVLETLGLARRQGVLQLGASGIERSGIERDPGSVIVLASDAAYRHPGTWVERAKSFLPAQILGQATGLDPVDALGVAASRLADQAAYWLNLWYETRAEENAPATLERGA